MIFYDKFICQIKKFKQFFGILGYISVFASKLVEDEVNASLGIFLTWIQMVVVTSTFYSVGIVVGYDIEKLRFCFVSKRYPPVMTGKNYNGVKRGIHTII